jgi:hypothetical protein
LRSLFPQNVQNLVDGGGNELRAEFSENIPNLIDGGLDSI